MVYKPEVVQNIIYNKQKYFKIYIIYILYIKINKYLNMNIKMIFLMIFQIAIISAYMPNHEYNMLEKRKSPPQQTQTTFNLDG